MTTKPTWKSRAQRALAERYTTPELAKIKSRPAPPLVFNEITPKPPPKPTRGGTRKGAGRKPLTPGAQSKVLTIRVTQEQAAKLARLGGAAWVRARIDRAKDPS